METSSQQLLHRAVAHIMNEMRNEGELDAWMDTHCSLFGTDVKAENDLAFTELHKEYETLVERSLEGFMATEHVGSTQVLFDLMVDATHKSPTSNRHMDVLLASGDFQKFVRLMRLRCQRRLRALEAEGKSEDAMYRAESIDLAGSQPDGKSGESGESGESGDAPGDKRFSHK